MDKFSFLLSKYLEIQSPFIFKTSCLSIYLKLPNVHVCFSLNETDGFAELWEVQELKQYCDNVIIYVCLSWAIITLLLSLSEPHKLNYLGDFWDLSPDVGTNFCFKYESIFLKTSLILKQNLTIASGVICLVKAYLNLVRMNFLDPSSFTYKN